MQVTAKMEEYWRKNLRITALLLAIWFLATFVVIYFAIPLAEIKLLGFPFSFYMGAQGALIIYVVIIAFYAGYMNRLDREFGVHEDEE